MDLGCDDLYALETEMFALSATKTDVLPPPTIAGRFIRAKNRNRRCRSAPATFCYYSTKMKYCWAQRPPSGLWGGLYCFPQFADEESLRHWLAQRQIAADNLTQLTAFRHTFSHFHLDIVPMWLPVSSFTGCMDEGNALWYNLAQPPSVGLAAPVERLLQQLRTGAPV
ncbi:adenine DNA glycosylase [Escherichia coli]|uniref:Adenine DNA glycosylase n=1 Tax=Escherichia coli TaxID=562 RepID=A0A2X3K1J1_ECOLX|nr:adenine DNA glycosylase [Escherichia coli]